MNVRFSRTALVLAALTAFAAAPALAQDCEVKVGVVGPMTGGASPWGLAAKTATEFVAALTNEEGGLPVAGKKCRVKVHAVDALYTAAGGAAASNTLASESVHVVIGPVGSPETAGFRPVAKRHGQINFSTSYMEGVISQEFPLAFHALQSPVTYAPFLLKAALEQFKFKSVLIVGANDQGGTDGTKQVMKIYEQLGVKAEPEYFQRGTTNFSPLATRIMNAKPDAVDLATMPPQDANVLVKALTDAGFTGIYGAMGGVGLAPVVQGAGGIDKVKGYYYLEITPQDHPGVLKMKADYQRVMKSPATENTIFPTFVLASEVALRGISTAGTDQDVEKIADAIRKNPPESRYMGKAGWRGKAIYGINQEVTFPAGLGLVVNGKKMPSLAVPFPAE